MHTCMMGSESFLLEMDDTHSLSAFYCQFSIKVPPFHLHPGTKRRLFVRALTFSCWGNWKSQCADRLVFMQPVQTQ